MNAIKKKIIHAVTVLTLAAILGTGLVAVSHDLTQERIEANKRAELMGKLNILVPKARYDNDLFTDIAIVHNEALLGTDRGVSIYRARKEGQPVAAVVASTAPDGYNGEIRLLVGINYDGTLIGVRVVGHKETPGLGDMIDARRSNWILSFDGLSLNNLTRTSWNVKRDGGVFDQFTGATITPRAVVKAVHNTLLHFEQNRDDIFSIATASTIAE